MKITFFLYLNNTYEIYETLYGILMELDSASYVMYLQFKLKFKTKYILN